MSSLYPSLVPGIVSFCVVGLHGYEQKGERIFVSYVV